MRTPHALLVFVALLSTAFPQTPVDYGLAQLTAASGRPATELNLHLETVTALGPEGFALVQSNGKLLVQGGDARGLMYGLLDVSEQLRRGTALATIPPRTERARLPFRAIKFNLPFAAYRTGPSIELHQDTCRDVRFWTAFLDMMAANRFNTLTLWSLHPFHYLTVPKSFPEAQSFSSAELAEYRTLFSRIFALAKERGIETYLVNWNTFVSPGFARAHNLATYSLEWRHFGDGPKDKLVEAYTRECVQQTLDEYPDLTGLGITLGERMGGLDPAERRQWLDNAFFAGMQAARRPAKFLYRAPLSADTKSGGTTSEENDRLTRAQIENLGGKIQIPVSVEFKFNWSHGHSSPQLFLVHGGKLSDAYWNPPPKNYQVVWTVRNEDFHVLRWGDPQFIRDFVQHNGAAHVGGALLGSEVFVPAKDYTSLDGPWKTWRYDFERQWLMYALWGRLLYNPATPDTALAALFSDRFGTASSSDLLAAWSHASRTPLRFASFHQGRIDGSLYTEAFSSWSDRGAALRFFDVNNLITHPVLDSRYVNIADFVQAGQTVASDKISPLALADTLDRDLAEVTRLVTAIRARSTPSPTLDAELTDLECWAAFGNYLAEKIRGGVALAAFRTTHAAANQAAAVQHLERALVHWKSLAALGARYNKEDILFHTHAPFSWKRQIEDVARDIEIARTNQLPAPPAPRAPARH